MNPKEDRLTGNEKQILQYVSGYTVFALKKSIICFQNHQKIEGSSYCCTATPFYFH